MVSRGFFFLICCRRSPRSLSNLLEYAVTDRNFMSCFRYVEMQIYGIRCDMVSHQISFVLAWHMVGCHAGVCFRKICYKKKSVPVQTINCWIILSHCIPFFWKFYAISCLPGLLQNGSQNSEENQHKN